ncbi:MAG: pilus assembly protein [Chloroflexi bacterium]|nr:pilus assembly protein [Chloroflexota bacterium]
MIRRPRTNTRKRGDRGQALVELAMIAPVLIIIMLGVIDYGRIYFAYVSVTNGARNGADYAAIGPTEAADTAGIKAAALTDTSDLLDQSATNPDVAVVTANDSQGSLYADVTMTYTFTTLFPWPGLPTSINVERTVRSRVAP